MPAQPTDLVSFLASTELFQSISVPALEYIAGGLEIVSVPCGAYLIPKDASHDDLRVVVSGTVAVTSSGSDGMIRFLKTLGPGESAGGWLTGGADSADFIAVEDTIVGRFSREAFDLLAQQYPGDANTMMQSVIKSLHRSRLLHALYLSELFGDLDTVVLRELENNLELVTFSSGQAIVRQGDIGDYAYVLVSGRARVVFQDSEGHDRVIAELGAGEVIGEMALLANEPRTTTVYAIRDTQAARLSRSKFEQFIENHPRDGLQVFTRKTVTRLVKQLSGSAPARQNIRTVAIVPAGRDAPLAEFASRFSHVLSRLAPTQHVNPQRVDSALGKQGAAQAPEYSTQNLRLVEWLNQCESENQYVVYECDASSTPWSRRCLRQADYILAVGRAGADSTPGEVEGHLADDYRAATSIRQSLVLVHDDAHSPSGTAQWLTSRKVDEHFNVRLNSIGDIERIVRFLIGRAFGLTLGGGFARGLVHIGVIRALQEAGIAIDAIGGNSMGAVIAAQWAQGWDWQTMLRRTAEGCRVCIKDMTLPIISFKSGRRFSDLIQSFNGEQRIEDLWIPFFCVSANLNRAELKIHKEGSLAKAILASSRVPGVFPPIIYDGEMHIDGGILNNVPVDVMRDITRNGIVMGVDAAPSREFGPVQDFGFEMTGWQVLRKRIDGLPNILQMMLRTVELGGVYRKRSLSSVADVYLRPPLNKYKPADFSMASEIVDVGYRSAVEALEAWFNNQEIDARRKPQRRGDELT